MFYLIETDIQFKTLRSKITGPCYIDYIYGNDNTHPALAEIIAIYISNLDEDKGYILPINHPECINLWKDEPFIFLSTLEEIHVLDIKTKHKTHLIFKNMELNTGLEDAQFHEMHLKRLP